MTRGSLVSRLIWYLTAAMAVLWLLGSVTAGALTVFEINERLDNALEEVAQRLLPATFSALQEPEAMQRMARRLVATMDPKALAYQIIDPTGRIAMRSENAPKAPFPVPRKQGFYDVPHYRVYSQVAAEGYVIDVAEPAMHRRQALRRAIALSVGPLLFFLPLSWILIRWTVFRSMGALKFLRDEIGRRDGSNLTQILDPGMPSELAPILSAVNRLLQRLERALLTERQFAANSAHELRTPIAAVQAQTQLLAVQLAGTPQMERAERIVAQIKALGGLAERLLQLSRTGAGLALRRERTDVVTVLQVLIDEFRRGEDVGPRLRFDGGERARLVVWADLDLIGIALRNLIENAIRYGTSHEPIEVIVEGGRSVRILNGGLPLPSDRLELLKQPFVRGSSLPGGGGLGLAIVENVMRQLDGRLLLASPPEGRVSGFEARLVFPEPETRQLDQRAAAGRTGGARASAGSRERIEPPAIR